MTYLNNLNADQLAEAHKAADYLLSLPARLNTELAAKLDTLRADLTAEMEDRDQATPGTHRTARTSRATIR